MNTFFINRTQITTLHKKPYFPGPGISWKAQKGQVNIIFASTFWLDKDRFFHHRKVQNKNFSVAQNKNLSVDYLFIYLLRTEI